MRLKGYVVYDEPYRMNIVGWRENNARLTHFDDHMYIFYKDDKGKWVFFEFKVTTDPSEHYMLNPLDEVQHKGTAILKEGQYINAYEKGLHNGKYPALVQVGPVTVYRNLDRRKNLQVEGLKTETGYFGINIHRARSYGETILIGLNSAGCQVFAKADEFEKLMSDVDRHHNLYGKFTYTLIDQWMESRKTGKIVFWSIVGLATIGGLALTKRIA